MEEKSAFVNDDTLYNKKIESVPKPEKEIGIDQDDTFYKNIILGAETQGISSTVDISAIESFSNISQSRDQVYALLDTMSADSKVAAILQTYAADATETNDEGKIVWVESSNADVSKYVSYLLDSLQVDKHVYGWIYSLAKYGDLYLRLYRESEYDDQLLFGNQKEKEKLDESVLLKAFKENDDFVHYIDMVPNPAEVFELVKFGKTHAYIKTNITLQKQPETQSPAAYVSAYRYSFNRSDVEVYQPNMFVHAFLEDTSNRSPEIVEIFRDSEKDTAESNASKTKYDYTVRRGKSMLYDRFKIWRLLSLLEDSLVLNRLTKSSVIRVIGVQIGDMPKENVQPHLTRVKSLFEQKSALSTDVSMSEYTAPGPMENSVYVPIRGEQGAITVSTIGGDVNIKDIADIDFFTNLFYGSFGIPKQYFGMTDDGAGFNGGTSLSILSSRYAKDVKKIQNSFLQALTTAINIMLLDKGLESYVNKFTLRMLAPTTQEELDRRDNTNSKMQIIQDAANLIVDDIEDPIIKLKIKKALFSTATSNEEVISLIDEQITKLESNPELEEAVENNDLDQGRPEFGGGFDESEPLDLNSSALSDVEAETEQEANVEEEQPSETILPTPDELGLDMTQNEE